jgi:hypothetical protein
MARPTRSCPDCKTSGKPSDIRVVSWDRREFLKATGTAVAAAGTLGAFPLIGRAEPTIEPKAESLVKTLYDSLTESQRPDICHGWDFVDADFGLLRTHVANNWQIGKHSINDDFFSKDQREIIRGIFEAIIQPDWHKKIDKQLQDDAGGWGNEQSLAIFGVPGKGKFEFVMTGRHMTLRCDGNSADHVAFGGPIFYGHAASDFDEPADHPGNVFWEQALAANHLYKMLDGRQRELAMVAERPREQAVAFQGASGEFPGIPVTEMSSDQRDHLQKVLQKLLEPYRQSDKDEALACLKAQGGLDKCSLAFYRDGDIGDDGVWDNWRLEGPAFVWYFRGEPHVHVWVNIADDPSVKTNA